MTQQNLKLSILDQSIVRKNGTAAQAIAETIETAKMADRLGFHRFWVSEHHNTRMIAGSTPEVLMVKLAEDHANATREYRDEARSSASDARSAAMDAESCRRQACR